MHMSASSHDKSVGHLEGVMRVRQRGPLGGGAATVHGWCNYYTQYGAGGKQEKASGGLKKKAMRGGNEETWELRTTKSDRKGRRCIAARWGWCAAQRAWSKEKCCGFMAMMLSTGVNIDLACPRVRGSMWSK